MKKLSWNEQILIKQGKLTTVFLWRNVYNCPAHVKCNICKIMVRPILEYASTAWDPHTNLNINLLKVYKDQLQDSVTITILIFLESL